MTHATFSAPLRRRKRLLSALCLSSWSFSSVQSTPSQTPTHLSDIIPQQPSPTTLISPAPSEISNQFFQDVLPFQDECIAHVAETRTNEGTIRLDLMCDAKHDHVSYLIPSVNASWIMEKTNSGELVNGKTILVLPSNTVFNQYTHEIYISELPILWHDDELVGRQQRRRLNTPTTSISPSQNPSHLPSLAPSSGPSLRPSQNPSSIPSILPSGIPSVAPSIGPSVSPSILPSMGPSSTPSLRPSLSPSILPSRTPSLTPSIGPSRSPSILPSLSPSRTPSIGPSRSPSILPSSNPSNVASESPSMLPSVGPSGAPTGLPSAGPSSSLQPSKNPTTLPSLAPSTRPSGSNAPSSSLVPSVVPTGSDRPSLSQSPSLQPSSGPSIIPSRQPSVGPSIAPTGSQQPSLRPTGSSRPSISKAPSSMPSQNPSLNPSLFPSLGPSVSPSSGPSIRPSFESSNHPSVNPSTIPSTSPSILPSNRPSRSLVPSFIPTTSQTPSAAPSSQPSNIPTATPSKLPTGVPSLTPSLRPTMAPSAGPTAKPSGKPSSAPSTSFSPSRFRDTPSPTAAIPIDRSATISVEIDANGLNNLDVICKGGFAPFLTHEIANAFDVIRTNVTCMQEQVARPEFLDYEKPVQITVFTTFRDYRFAPRAVGFLNFLEDLIVSARTLEQLPIYLRQALIPTDIEGDVYVTLSRKRTDTKLVVAIGDDAPSASPTIYDATNNDGSNNTLAPIAPSSAAQRAFSLHLPLVMVACVIVGTTIL